MGRVGQMVVAVGVALVALGILIASSDGPGKSIRQAKASPASSSGFVGSDKAVRRVENYAPDGEVVERMRRALANYNAGEYDATVAEHGVSVLAAKWSGVDPVVTSEHTLVQPCWLCGFITPYTSMVISSSSLLASLMMEKAM